MNLTSRAAANAVRAIGGSLPLALLPSFLSRELSEDSFSVWLLIAQVAIYVAYLELGVQATLIRATGSAVGRSGVREAADDIAGGLRLLTISTAVAAGTAMVAAALLPVVFDVPATIANESRIAAAVLGISSALALTGSAVHGTLIGTGSHWASALIVTVCRIAGVAAALLAARSGASLPVLALCIGASNLVSSIAAHAYASRVGIPIRYRNVSRAHLNSIRHVMVTLGLTNLSMLVIAGVDIVVVGRLDYSHVGAYGLAASLVLMGVAGYSVIGSALLPVLSGLIGQGRPADAERLMWKATALGASVLGTAFALLVEFRDPISARWAGEYADDTLPALLILAAAQVLRLALLPITTLVLASDHHSRVRRPAFAEAGTNLVLSIALGVAFGYVGVAVGTLLGSAVGLPFYLRSATGSIDARLVEQIGRHLAVPLLIAALISFSLWFVEPLAASGAVLASGLVALAGYCKPILAHPNPS